MSEQKTVAIPIFGAKEAVAVIFSDEAMKALNIDAGVLAQMFQTRDPDRLLAEMVLPEIKYDRSPNMMMKFSTIMGVIGRWRTAEMALLIGAARAARDLVKTGGDLLGEMKQELEKAEQKLTETSSLLKQATERNGLWATQDKKDLAQARETIQQLENRVAVLLHGMDREQANVEGLQVTIQDLRGQLRDANGHGQKVLEYISDNWPKPTAYVAKIIGEVKETLRLTTVPQ